ncbi:MAG: biopolymer transporter ExbD [Victivallales bacterium]|jgi:biopolymer transport protein ExbD
MRERKEEEYMSGNLTAMIDVVFQLIIFFVCTTNMQNSVDDRIQLAIAPNGKPVTKKDPREIKIDVDAKGHISIARTYVSPELLKSIVKKSMQEYGNDTPIIIRGDSEARHLAIQSAMNACTDAGIYKIKFSVLKEKGR